MLSKEIYIDVLPPSVNTQRLLDHAIGDILGHFFLDDHTVFPFPRDFQIISLALKDLKDIANTICIAFGTHKAEAIVYAAAERYIKTLVTDEVTARAIINHVGIASHEPTVHHRR